MYILQYLADKRHRKRSKRKNAMQKPGGSVSLDSQTKKLRFTPQCKPQQYVSYKLYNQISC